MNSEKLEALRKLATDERTPIEEARNAALQYVRAGGRVDALDAPSNEYKEKYREALLKMEAWSIALSEAGSLLAKINGFTRDVTYVKQDRIHVASGSDQSWLRDAIKKEFR
jgi:hypothetical protein